MANQEHGYFRQLPGLPMMHSLQVFAVPARTEINPLQVCTVHRVDPLNLRVRGVLTRLINPPNIGVQVVQSKAVLTSHILHFIGCVKPCALHLKSKCYTQNKILLYASLVKG